MTPKIVTSRSGGSLDNEALPFTSILMHARLPTSVLQVMTVNRKVDLRRGHHSGLGSRMEAVCKEIGDDASIFDMSMGGSLSRGKLGSSPCGSIIRFS